MPDLDAGDPVEFGAEHRALLARHPQINVLAAAAAPTTAVSPASAGACRLTA